MPLAALAFVRLCSRRSRRRRGGPAMALAEGVLFTWLLVLRQRLDRKDVDASVVLGLRFSLYLLAAGALGALGLDAKAPLGWDEAAVIVAMGFLLIIPRLHALHRAVAQVSTLAISVLTALGPFVIFLMQAIEGRVEQSSATLIGLAIFFAGSVATAFGALRAAKPT